MPAPLSSKVRQHLTDLKLSPAEVEQLAADLKARQISRNELTNLVSYSDLFEAGAGERLSAVLKEARAPASITAPIRSLGDNLGTAAVLRGDRELSRTLNQRHSSVALFQRALVAIASRTGHPEYALLEGGITGTFDAAMQAAVEAFQTQHGLAPSGVLDAATAMKIERELVTHAPPNIGGILSASSRPSGQAIAEAALRLIQERGADYGVNGNWRSPNPKAPGNRIPNQTLLGAVGRWKCNLFGLDALYLAGAKVPQYGSGWYPIAVEIPNYTKGTTPAFIKLGEVSLEALSEAERRQRVEELLFIAQPGDVIIVDHPGTEQADGGHTRVVVANEFQQNGTVSCAQASVNTALVRAQTVGDFVGEEKMYLLRANQLR